MFILIPSLASAHTALSSSNPEEGEVVQDELKEVTVQFETKIEEISTIKLKKDNQEIPFKEVQVEEQQMIGLLQDTLPNGSYMIEWTIVGEDGHPISGEIPFMVKGIEQTEDSGVSDQNQSNQEDETKEKTDSPNPEKNNEPIEDKAQSSSSLTLILIVVLTLILGVSLGLILKKKR